MKTDFATLTVRTPVPLLGGGIRKSSITAREGLTLTQRKDELGCILVDVTSARGERLSSVPWDNVGSVTYPKLAPAVAKAKPKARGVDA